MIIHPYRDSRFLAPDLTLIDKAWETTDEIEQGGSSGISLEVLSGERYRRPIRDRGLGGIAYLLQILVRPPRNLRTYEEWRIAAQEILERFEKIAKDVSADTEIAEPTIIFPEGYGPFGAPDASDPPRIQQPVLYARHTQDDCRKTQIRVGVEFTGSAVMNDVSPQGLWSDHDVAAARRGFVVIPRSNELHKG